MPLLNPEPILQSLLDSGAVTCPTCGNRMDQFDAVVIEGLRVDFACRVCFPEQHQLNQLQPTEVN